MHITLWGGANSLAQALHQVRATRSAADLAKFVSKIRVHAISDQVRTDPLRALRCLGAPSAHLSRPLASRGVQDDSGPWIRKNFPELSYVVSISARNSCVASALVIY